MHDTNRLTTITISRENWKKLKSMGQATESLNDVLSRLLRNVQLDAIAMDLVRGGNEPT